MAYDILPMPKGCRAQTMRLRAFRDVAGLPPSDIVSYFRTRPDDLKRVLAQSYDKRYSPSTFVDEVDGAYAVGWFDHSRQHVQHFSDAPEAIADYLLFSFGRGRLQC
jgi:hypothetical protein